MGNYFTRSDCNLKNMFYKLIGGHNMRKIITFFSLITVLVLVLYACCEKTDGEKGGDERLQGKFITSLKGGSSGVYLPLGGTLAKIYTNMGATANSQSTDASATNATTLNHGKAEVAFAMGDTISD